MSSSLRSPRRFPNALGVLVIAAVPGALGLLILLLAAIDSGTVRTATSSNAGFVTDFAEFELILDEEVPQPDHVTRSERSAPMPTTAQRPPARPASSDPLVALGESLFKNTRLSSTGKMSCATCHVPERSFTEDKPLAVGQDNVTLGRNTPTLVGLVSVKEFPVGGSFMRAPDMSPLEDRVLLPLKDVAEMSGSVGEAIERLRTEPQIVERFQEVFQEAGITSERLGTALAAYVRTLEPKKTPGLAALAGDVVVLDEPAARGLALFKGEGRCDACHSGPSLTDGKLHLASKFKPSSLRVGARVVTPADVSQNERPNATAHVTAKVEAFAAAAQSGTDTRPDGPIPGGNRRRGVSGAYGPSMALERQTLTLLDVKRTGPWFRDGSAATLSEAVRRHVAELREVGAVREEVGKNPLVLLVGLNGKNAPFGSTQRQIPGSSTVQRMLSPSAKAQIESDTWIPAEVTKPQVDDLVAFLHTLSPSD
jgi:cytochrome c peroxidase